MRYDAVVAPGGGSGTGSLIDPWSLAYMLSGAGGGMVPGIRVWVRGGLYTGAFASAAGWAGTAARRIAVFGLPNERPILDRASATGAGANTVGLEVKSDYTDWWDLELTNSNTDRSNTDRPHGLILNADHVRALDCVIHDAGRAGIYHYETKVDAEIRGCILFNNGYQDVTRGNGHGLYLKSNVGPVLVRQIACFNNYGFGLHNYSDTGAGGLKNIFCERSTFFNTGSVSNQPTSSNSNVLIGGQEPSDGCTALFNRLWFNVGFGSFNLRLGQDPANTMIYALIADNIVARGSSVLDIGTWTALDFLRNKIYGTSRVVTLAELSPPYGWDANVWYRLASASAWKHNGVDKNFATWKTDSGLGSTDTNPGTVPTVNEVAVEAMDHRHGRALVTVYNWEAGSSVSVEMSGILQPGDRYTVHTVARLDQPVSGGLYAGGTISIPLSAIAGPTPIGGANAPPATGPDFDCFLVQRVPAELAA